MLVDSGSIHALVFDIDGTLISDDKTVSDTLRDYINRLCSTRRIKVVLASSRSDDSLRLIARRLGIDCGLVCFDGGLVLDDSLRRVAESFLETSLAPPVLDAARDLGLTSSLFDRGGWFTSDSGYWTRREIRGTGVEPKVVGYAELLGRIREAADPAYKLMFRGAEDAIRALSSAPCVQHLCQVNTGYSNRPSIFEVVSAGADKFSACTSLLSTWGIPQDATVFFGDGVNDISCLAGFPHSVAMGNAQDSVKRHARYVTGSNNEDGVFRYLERLFRN
jgi:Cof subfamily protein (haloacid dehalogenase superfamily)